MKISLEKRILRYLEWFYIQDTTEWINKDDIVERAIESGCKAETVVRYLRQLRIDGYIQKKPNCETPVLYKYRVTEAERIINEETQRRKQSLTQSSLSLG